MSVKLPIKLINSPLRETIFECRFEPTMEGLGDLLPGALYASLKDDYPELTTLPLSHVPRAVRDKNPALLFQHSHRLSGSKGMVQIGDRLISIIVRDYPGWPSLRERAEFLIGRVKQTGFVKEPERFSIKYANVIAAPPSKDQFSLINMKVEIGQQSPTEKGFILRYEIQKGNYTTIIQVIPNTIVQTNDGEITGLLLDIDTIRDKPGQDFWNNPAPLLEEAHIVAKTTFISLLTKSALEEMKPVW